MGVNAAPAPTVVRQNVLSTVADTRAATAQTSESSASIQPCNVRDAVFSGVLPREEALHNLQPGIPGGDDSYLLFW